MMEALLVALLTIESVLVILLAVLGIILIVRVLWAITRGEW